ncbi:MAG: DUF1566 domain-containing protein [Rhodoferax sp.]|nr:DUF1566 domain-containing protein [Rhodoferax sp.]
MIKLKLFATSVACLMGLALTACGGGSSGGGAAGEGIAAAGAAGGGTATTTPPSITTQPVNQSVVAGTAATFTSVASGSETLTYQWKKNDSDIPDATSSAYTLPTTSMEDNGAVFSVAVTNSGGTVTSDKASLTVSVAPVAPAVRTQPSAQSLATGQPATFTVEATGTSPLHYQWKLNGKDIPTATSSSYTLPASTMADSGAAYSVVISNAHGTVTSNPAILTVTVLPVISKQPAAQTVDPGKPVTFSVEATGTAPLSYQWKRNGTDIPNATSSSYTLLTTSKTDNDALFSVVVSNKAATVTSSAARLTVNEAPAFTVQPASQTVYASQTASFSVSATGTAPLTYQWKKNGIPIDGAPNSSSYTTPATSNADIGTATYSVAVSNSAGTATSGSATLTVSAKYSLVPKSGGTYTKEECVKDNITGLVWEGKNPSGSSSRVSTSTYTNYDGTGSGQKSNGVNATAAELSASTNSSSYVNSVNGSNLCGFTDWRMPTKEELQGIVVSGPGPTIDAAWFPHTQTAGYWTASQFGVFSFSAWFVGFGYGNTDNIERSNLHHIRLVR